MPSDIDVYQPPVVPPRPGEPGDPPAAEEPAPAPEGDVPGPVPIAAELAPSSVGDEPGEPLAPPEAQEPIPDVISASSDDLTASLTQARPDPLLGAFVTEESPGAAAPAPIGEFPADEIQGHGPHPGSRADAMLALGSLNFGGDVATTGPGLSGTSSDALAGIAFDTSQHAPAAAERAPAEKDEDEDEDDEDEAPTKLS